MERVAERIRKLLALANNNPSEAEAAIALERASALMAEHNLTMAQVDAHGTGEERIEEKHNAAYREQTWARLIWGSVAQLNFCMYSYWHNNRGDVGWRKLPGGELEKIPPREVDEHCIIGTRANVETAKAMVDYLVSTIERLARESKLTSVRDLHAFKLGCARRLEVRLDLLHDKKMKAKRRASAATTLPVLADVYAAHKRANEDLYVKMYGKPCPGAAAISGPVEIAPTTRDRVRAAVSALPRRWDEAQSGHCQRDSHAMDRERRRQKQIRPSQS
jgi:uncharacterized protein DUF2786